MVLEAGRWAPSYANSQPWTFIVVRDESKRRALEELVLRISLANRGSIGLTTSGTGNAPVVIAIAVDPWRDNKHYIEAGAIAAQNMALVASSLGLGTFWAGVFDLEGKRRSIEGKIKKVLGIPKEMRVIALLPLGVPAYSPKHDSQTRRADLSDFVRYDGFENKEAECS
jgi:nitroreductase